MKVKVILFMLLALLGISVNGQSDSATCALEHRIVVLESEKEIRDGQVQNQSNQLKTDFDRLKQDSTSQGMTIWIAIVAGMGALGFGIWGTIKLAKNHAAILVQSRLDKELPPMVQQRMEESFEKLLKKHSQTIMDMIGERDRIERFKREKRILILSEESTEGEKIAHLLNGIGYDNVKAQTATVIPDSSTYDLLIFVREKGGPNAFENLTDQMIWDFSESLPPNHAFMYYGPNVDRFNSIPREKIQFANIVFTINSRILQVFEYTHALNNLHLPEPRK